MEIKNVAEIDAVINGVTGDELSKKTSPLKTVSVSDIRCISIQSSACPKNNVPPSAKPSPRERYFKCFFDSFILSLPLPIIPSSRSFPFLSYGPPLIGVSSF